MYIKSFMRASRISNKNKVKNKIKLRHAKIFRNIGNGMVKAIFIKIKNTKTLMQKLVNSY